MIKTTYQTPEIRDANDNVIQQGAFGKNTALSNSTNDGWIDYVMNDLEALHDTIGDSSPTLDGNGHVVEPANLAIGDEDGNRLKTSYLKLTGGTVTGTTNFQQNVKFQDNQENVFGGVYIPSSSATEQYAQFYGGESTGVAGAKLTLYPDGDGRFKLEARSTDGANTYTLVTDNNGNLNWRGYPLAWKKDYLPLAGGTMSGTITTTTDLLVKRSTTSNAISLQGSPTWNDGATLTLYGKDNANSGRFILAAYNGSGGTSGVLRGYPDGALTWNGNAIALSKDVLSLAGGTISGTITVNSTTVPLRRSANNSWIQINGGNATSDGANLILFGKDESRAGAFWLTANDGSTTKQLIGTADGTLTWGGQDLNPQKETGYFPNTLSVPSGSTATELTSFSITKGTWLVCYSADFASNATGYRVVRISASTTGGGVNRLAEVHAGAANGTTTRLNGSAILRVGATTTYYLNVIQNSGSTLNVMGGVQTFRLSTVS